MMRKNLKSYFWSNIQTGIKSNWITIGNGIRRCGARTPNRRVKMVAVDFSSVEPDIRGCPIDLNISYDKENFLWTVEIDCYTLVVKGVSRYLGVAILECLLERAVASDRAEMAAEAMAWAGYTDYGDSEEE